MHGAAFARRELQPPRASASPTGPRGRPLQRRHLRLLRQHPAPAIVPYGCLNGSEKQIGYCAQESRLRAPFVILIKKHDLRWLGRATEHSKNQFTDHSERMRIRCAHRACCSMSVPVPPRVSSSRLSPAAVSSARGGPVATSPSAAAAQRVSPSPGRPLCAFSTGLLLALSTADVATCPHFLACSLHHQCQISASLINFRHRPPSPFAASPTTWRAYGPAPPHANVAAAYASLAVARGGSRAGGPGLHHAASAPIIARAFVGGGGNGGGYFGAAPAWRPVPPSPSADSSSSSGTSATARSPGASLPRARLSPAGAGARPVPFVVAPRTPSNAAFAPTSASFGGTVDGVPGRGGSSSGGGGHFNSAFAGSTGAASGILGAAFSGGGAGAAAVAVRPPPAASYVIAPMPPTVSSSPFVSTPFTVPPRAAAPLPPLLPAVVPAPALRLPASPRQQLAFSVADLTMLSTVGTGTFGRVRLVRMRASQQTYALKIMKKSEVRCRP